MLDQLISYRCKASTILETLVAAMILLISFSAGLAIYNKVLLAGPSPAALRASYSQKALADSLVLAGDFQTTEFIQGELIHRVLLEDYPGFSGIQCLTITSTDPSGKKLSECKRLIPKSHE